MDDGYSLEEIQQNIDAFDLQMKSSAGSAVRALAEQQAYWLIQLSFAEASRARSGHRPPITIG